MLYCRFKDYEQAVIFFGRGYKSAVGRHDNNEAYRFACYLMNTYCQTGDLNAAREYYDILKNMSTSNRREKEYYDLYSAGTLAYAEIITRKRFIIILKRRSVLRSMAWATNTACRYMLS